MIPIPLPDLHKPAPQPLPIPGAIPPDHMRRILSGLERFRQEHGRRLADLGWNRETLFFGAIPEEAKTYDELHGLTAILADGGRLVQSTVEMLVFELGERRLAWMVDGYFVGWYTNDSEGTK